MSLRLDVPVLHGSLVRLEPLAMSHAPDLALAAAEERSSYGFTLVPRAAEVKAYLAAQFARDGLTPFAQIRMRDGWSASARASRACCAVGRPPGHRAKKGCCETRPCSL